MEQVKYLKLDLKNLPKKRIPAVTVHGRFQPPLHINHWNYIAPAFELAEKVIILITNPDLDEVDVKETGHRNKKENNPFTYGQRVKIFQKFFEAMGLRENATNSGVQYNQRGRLGKSVGQSRAKLNQHIWSME